MCRASDEQWPKSKWEKMAVMGTTRWFFISLSLVCIVISLYAAQSDWKPFSWTHDMGNMEVEVRSKVSMNVFHVDISLLGSSCLRPCTRLTWLNCSEQECYFSCLQIATLNPNICIFFLCGWPSPLLKYTHLSHWQTAAYGVKMTGLLIRFVNCYPSI